jgi:hypothetical protein
MSYQFYNDVEKFEQLENQRVNTVNDPQYQQWVKELHVSQSYVDPSAYVKANELNKQYDYSTISDGRNVMSRALRSLFK